MGAGDGSGPDEQQRSSPRQAGGQGGGSEERNQSELRHQHADDEQRLRHGDVVERRVATCEPPAVGRRPSKGAG